MFEQVWWEVGYTDGTTISELRGAKYENIDRTRFATFTLHAKDIGPIVQLAPEDDRSGQNLVYRKRTVWLDEQAVDVYIVGWVPQGPIFAFSAEGDLLDHKPSFVYGHPVFYPPLAHASERWYLEAQTKIINPLYERTD